MSGAIPPFSQYASLAWCSVKAQGQLYQVLNTHNVFWCSVFILTPFLLSAMVLILLNSLINMFIADLFEAFLHLNVIQNSL